MSEIIAGAGISDIFFMGLIGFMGGMGTFHPVKPSMVFFTFHSSLFTFHSERSEACLTGIRRGHSDHSSGQGSSNIDCRTDNTKRILEKILS